MRKDRSGPPPGASRRAPLGASDPPRSDHEVGEGAALQVTPELADPLGALEVGEHQDVEQFGAESGTECVEALTQLALDCSRFTGSDASTRRR
jgi:hypothetical protein